MRSTSGVGRSSSSSGTLPGRATSPSIATDQGFVTSANLIIPTGQNLNNIEQDMHALVPQIMEQEPDQIRQTLEMLVRAYDPCISCATHLLDVKFV